MIVATDAQTTKTIGGQPLITIYFAYVIKMLPKRQSKYFNVKFLQCVVIGHFLGPMFGGIFAYFFGYRSVFLLAAILATILAIYVAIFIYNTQNKLLEKQYEFIAHYHESSEIKSLRKKILSYTRKQAKLVYKSYFDAGTLNKTEMETDNSDTEITNQFEKLLAKIKSNEKNTHLLWIFSTDDRFASCLGQNLSQTQSKTDNKHHCSAHNIPH